MMSLFLCFSFVVINSVSFPEADELSLADAQNRWDAVLTCSAEVSGSINIPIQGNTLFLDIQGSFDYEKRDEQVLYRVDSMVTGEVFGASYQEERHAISDGHTVREKRTRGSRQEELTHASDTFPPPFPLSPEIIFILSGRADVRIESLPSQRIHGRNGEGYRLILDTPSTLSGAPHELRFIQVWLDFDSGALLRMEGRDAQGDELMCFDYSRIRIDRDLEPVWEDPIPVPE